MILLYIISMAMRMTKNKKMEMMNRSCNNVEYEGMSDDDHDGGFYAELRRQILVLMEDDDEDFLKARLSNSISSSCERGSSMVTGSFPSAVGPAQSYFSSWSGRENADSVPTWLVNLWRKGNGTGVFIPQIASSRRRHKPGRMNKAYKQKQAANYQIVPRANAKA